MQFSDYLNTAMQRCGLTQKELAAQVYRPTEQASGIRPITARTLQHWLSGTSLPASRLTYVSLGLALGLDYADISALVRTYTGRDLFVRTPEDIPLSAAALRLCSWEEYPAFCAQLDQIAAQNPPAPQDILQWAGEGPTRELQITFAACRTQEAFLDCFRQSLPSIMAGTKRLTNEIEHIYTLHAPDGLALYTHLENRLPFLSSNYEKLRSGRFDSGTAVLTIRLCLFLGFSAQEIDQVLCAGHYQPTAGSMLGNLLAQAAIPGRSQHEIWTALEQQAAACGEELPPRLQYKYLTGLKPVEKGLAAVLFGCALLCGRYREGKRFFTCLANLDSLLLGCLSGQYIHRPLQTLLRQIPTLYAISPGQVQPPRVFVQQILPALLDQAEAHKLSELTRPMFGLPQAQYAGDFRSAALGQSGTLRGPVPGSAAYCLPPDLLPDPISSADRGRLAEEYFFAALLYTLFWGRIYCGQHQMPIPSDASSPTDLRLYGLVSRYCAAHLHPSRPLAVSPAYGSAVRLDADGRTARIEALLTELTAVLADR
ncbi:hypothetical protein [Butyricicoccus pullicaecorum]|uniref:Uncharacterized protein n=1 Tax=Butyricicoccus pullicaecorum 1.2 TaxID=1203606 RepID=R8VXD6_9FIRM|nr:hypothetical protein [Butyricicoccus pullicaecorum]EOQ35582.1 hypothetical protein HMPREF1526_03049 [Butyricicoccus pullicaecorum 1.2]SKA67411.1 hypothetical protein SAMN02745978_02982 [Butyricicoccus pullicaecorum DSM 23266]